MYNLDRLIPNKHCRSTKIQLVEKSVPYFFFVKIKSFSNISSWKRKESIAVDYSRNTWEMNYNSKYNLYLKSCDGLDT